MHRHAQFGRKLELLGCNCCRRKWDSGIAKRREQPGALLHWITSSARSSISFGTVMPSAFAALRLITSSNLVGCSTGRSPGLAPRRILST